MTAGDFGKAMFCVRLAMHDKREIEAGELFLQLKKKSSGQAGEDERADVLIDIVQLGEQGVEVKGASDDGLDVGAALGRHLVLRGRESNASHYGEHRDEPQGGKGQLPPWHPAQG